MSQKIISFHYTLTDPDGEDEDTGGRVSEVIAVLALGVMEHHWRKTLP